MFTNNTMGLSEFSGQFGLFVVRNCQFSYAAKVPTRLAKRVVACRKPEFIEEAVRTEGIVGIVVPITLEKLVPENFGLAVSENPVASVLLLHEALIDIPGFQWETFESRIDPSASIHPSAFVSPQNVVIGKGCSVAPNAIILERSILNDSCSIGPGTVVGCDAFEVDVYRKPNRILRQAGGVWLGDNVEIQAKCTIVRSTFGGFTKLAGETKLDCQVHVAHDCDIGSRVRIAACAELSGRVCVKDDVFIGPNCSITNGVTIESGAHITIGAVVTKDVAAGITVSGNFAVEHSKLLSFVKGL